MTKIQNKQNAIIFVCIEENKEWNTKQKKPRKAEKLGGGKTEESDPCVNIMQMFYLISSW